MLLRVRRNAQITLPAGIRKAAHIEEGDFIDAQVDDEGTIVLRPQKLIDKSQAWFWTESWQAKEREADLSIERGDVEEFDNVEDAIRYLHDSRK